MADGNTPAPTWTSHALEWGIGSIVIGAFVLLAIVFGVLAAAAGLGAYVGTGYRLSVDEVEEVFICVAVAIGILMVLAALGICFGLCGLRHARTRKLPAGIPATGTAICLILVAFLGVSLGVTLMEYQSTMKDLRGRVPVVRP